MTMLKVAHIGRATPWEQLAASLARSRDLELDGIEVVIGDGCTCELSQSEESCRALADEAGRYGMPVLSVCLADAPGARIGADREDSRLQARERLRTASRICSWFGAGVLRFVPAGPGDIGGIERWSYQNALNETYRSLQLLRGDLERAGVIGAIEPCRHHFLLSPPEMRELIDRVNSPWIGAALDWSSCEACGSPLDWIETLQHRLRAVVTKEPVTNDVLPALLRSGFEGTVIVDEYPSAGG